MNERVNLLLVDDREDGLLALEVVLRSPRYNLLKASSGADALRKLLDHDVAVILLDVQMPGMDGFETASLIKTHERLKGVPIIFVTGIHGDPRLVNQGYEVGAIDYVCKPFEPYILQSKVSVLVDLHVKNAQEARRKVEAEYAAREQEALRASEKRFRDLSEELAAANAELRQFAWVASHDLKEPLRVVASYVTLLSRCYEGKLSPEADEYLGYVKEGVLRMNSLLEGLLSLTGISQEEVRSRPVELNRVFESVTQSLEVLIRENQAEVTRDELPLVKADPAQIGQVLQNLIANAIKFKRRDEPPRVHVGAIRRDGEWVLNVRDNGIGIKPQYTDRIFGVFQRLHSLDEYPGAGVGLAICKKIVDKHGGRIWVDSEPGAGSTFFFQLPHQESA